MCKLVDLIASLIKLHLICYVIASEETCPASDTSCSGATAPKAEIKGPLVTDKVILSIEKEHEALGDIVIGLFGGSVPKTVKNFVELCKLPEGEGYVGTRFHKIVPYFLIQGGDVVNNDGTGRMSIYGETFEDENFKIRHYGRGWVDMVNWGPNTNSCQFRIFLKRTPQYDGTHVVFGKVLEGMDVVQAIDESRVSVEYDFPPSTIVECRHEALNEDERFRVPRTEVP